MSPFQQYSHQRLHKRQTDRHFPRIHASTLQQARLPREGKALYPPELYSRNAVLQSIAVGGTKPVCSFHPSFWNRAAIRARNQKLIKSEACEISPNKNEIFWSVLFGLAIFLVWNWKMYINPKTCSIFNSIWTANWIWSITSQISILNLGAPWCEWMDGCSLLPLYAVMMLNREVFCVKYSTLAGTDLALMN